jgi:hypothetical protein
MNAYELLIANREADTPAGSQALGAMTHRLVSSPLAAVVRAAGAPPIGWRVCGAAIISPNGVLAELIRVPDPKVRLRGPEYAWTIYARGPATEVESDGLGMWSALYEALECFDYEVRETLLALMEAEFLQAR